MSCGVIFSVLLDSNLVEVCADRNARAACLASSARFIPFDFFHYSYVILLGFRHHM